MLTTILNSKREDFIKYINDIWKNENLKVKLEDFNRNIGDSKYSIIKFISILSEKMYNERLAAKIDNDNYIIGWQFYNTK